MLLRTKGWQQIYLINKIRKQPHHFDIVRSLVVTAGMTNVRVKGFEISLIPSLSSLIVKI